MLLSNSCKSQEPYHELRADTLRLAGYKDACILHRYAALFSLCITELLYVPPRQRYVDTHCTTLLTYFSLTWTGFTYHQRRGIRIIAKTQKSERLRLAQVSMMPNILMHGPI